MARILVLNCGSSSVKFAVTDTVSGKFLATGLVENVGKNALLKTKTDLTQTERSIPGADHQQALEAVVSALEELHILEGIHGIGHRVVHGGEKFSDSKLIDHSVLEAIRDCNDLAPLHNPANLKGIEVASKVFPELPQVAVFDTAFHQSLPSRAYLYPIPLSLYEKHGIRRYGFHGTSHRFVAQKALQILDNPKACIITAHLGNGSSAAAIQAGHSLDTTMGLTPMEGIPMGTRSGTIDPGIFFFLHHQLEMDMETINTMLNKESGLLGLSNLSNDMRTLTEAAEGGHASAEQAIDVFTYRLAKEIASLSVALPQLDALIFTGGIGENSTLVRSRTLGYLRLLGFEVDNVRNAEHGRLSNHCITTSSSTKALVIPTNEELLIALDTEALISPT